MRFRNHKYKWAKPFDQIRHQWSFVGPRGGISFHVSRWEGDDKGKHDQFGGPTAGLEFHRSFDPSDGREAPSHSPCWLLKTPCWHDGTSLYATENLWPMIEHMMPDHSRIFRLLEREYESHFSRYYCHAQREGQP